MAYVIAVFHYYAVPGIIAGALFWSIFFVLGLNRRFKEHEMFVILAFIFAIIEIALSHGWLGSLFYFVYASVFILGMLSAPQILIRFMVPRTGLGAERFEWKRDNPA